MRTGYLFALLACLGLLAGSAVATTHTISLGGETGLRLVEQTDRSLTFEVQVGELAHFDVQTPAGDYTRLAIPGFHHSREIGAPALPMMNELCEIPLGASVDIEIQRYETEEIVLAAHGISHPLLPAQPSVPKNADPATLPFHVNDDAYAPGQIARRDLVSVVDIGQMRSARIGRVEVAPISYDPGSGTITLHNNIRFTLHFQGADTAGMRELKAATYSPFFEIVYNRLAGYRSAHDDHPDLMDGPVTYVIVSDRMFEAELQPFIAWKTQQGFNVIEAYTDMPEVGDNTTSIQNYLHDLYEGGGPLNPSPTFVLFVGDVNLVPAFYSSGPTDLFYCDVTGDNIPEMYYGRFSARNIAELTPQIEKTLEYEMATFPDASYLAEVVLIAGVDGYFAPTYGNGQVNYGTRHYFNAEHGITGYIYLYPESGYSGPEIIQNVSDGVAFVNYSAHGYSGGWADPSFTNYDIDGLQNVHEYCLAIGNCCETSKFDVGDCFAEHWLRADEKGAIGYIGGANSTYWDEDYWWAVGAGPVIANGADYEQTGLGAYDGLWHTHGEAMDQWYVVQDALIFCGNLAVVQAGGWTSYYWRIYNLMGDPSLNPYLGVPTANMVVHHEFIDPQEGSMPTMFQIEAEPNSYVGLSKEGVLCGSGLVDASGTATIPVIGHGTSGTVLLVVTCQNKFPYFAELSVGNPAAADDGVSTHRLLLSAAPNPLRSDARILLSLDQAQAVSLRIHDLSGRLVRTIVTGQLPAGQHFYDWNGRDAAGRPVAGGVYLARLQAESGNRIWKLVLSD